MTNLVDSAIRSYRLAFGKAPDFVASAPGRINLIGEHTDYNDGFVLPAAINRRLCVAVGKRDDDLISFRSEAWKNTITFTIEELAVRENEAWANYPKGVLYFLAQAGFEVGGLNLCITTEIPQKAGLSSSAALEVATALAVKKLFQWEIDPVSLATLCRRAENEFVGVSCGIMDQFAAGFGRKGHALFLDCRSLEYELVPFPPGISLVICDTGIKREHATMEFNKRRQECQTGVNELSLVLPGIRALRDVDVSSFVQYENLLNLIIRKRCRHVINENKRVLEAVADLKKNDLSDFGKLMYQSHLSLKNCYEVSCDELDAIVDIAASTEGVIGARMTGAGFGGSAICLVVEKNVSQLEANLLQRFPEMTGLEPQVHRSEIDDGGKIEWRKAT